MAAVVDWTRLEQDQFRRLTRHFLRRLLDNELLSPDADRRDTLGVFTAAALSVARS